MFCLHPERTVSGSHPDPTRRELCEEFVDAHYPAIYRFFVWLTNNPDTAADLTQETFAAFWETAGSLAEGPDWKLWLYGIARNRWRKRCRAGARRTDPLDAALELPDTAPAPGDAVIASLEAEATARAVADLPADYREALVLRVFQELTYAQIAGLLGIGEGLARWRTHQARRLLRAALQEEEG